MKTTIKYKGIEFDVEFDYQPEEKQVRFDSNNTGYPGCAAEIGSIYVITHNGTDFLEFFENNLELIRKAIWKALEELNN
ncbi:hypothetical protein LCGC14_2695760 [marine sediment metagenome]|uniref:Uncharacterized protein n=1 Tax=marine sediment metagenome TaxID=412755 RepID=A0A0F9A4R7_9ZZZZ